MAVSVYDDSFSLPKKGVVSPKGKESKLIALTLGKKLGFMLAYCDNDGSKEREHFIGSVDIKAVNGNKNLGYIIADVFQKLTLI